MKSLILAATVFADDRGASAGLGEVIDDLTTMQVAIQDEHDMDARAYEETACHCDDETTRLAREIKKESTDIFDASGDIKDGTATQKDMQETIQESNESRVKDKKNEKARKKAFTENQSSLTADINEASQAVNALEAAAKFFKDDGSGEAAHDEIRDLINQMGDDIRADLQEHAGNLKDARATDQAAFNAWDNKDQRLKKLVLDSEKTLSEAEEKIATNTEKMMSAEDTVKPLHKQLGVLTKYCERHAHDWDKHSAMRKKDFGVYGVAINVLTCGKEACSKDKVTFLQVSVKEQKAALHTLLAAGAHSNSKAMAEFAAKVKVAEDPLLQAKKLLRQLMLNLIQENKDDILEMGACVATLEECKVRRGTAFENMRNAKSTLEKLGSTIVNNKQQFADESENWATETNNMQQSEDFTIPGEITEFEDIKARMLGEGGKLEHALTVLREHFGITARADESQQSSSGLGDSGTKPGDRKEGDAGTNQSNGVMIVGMLQRRLDKHEAALNVLRKDHEDALNGMRDERTDAASSAAASQKRMDILKEDIEEDTAEFQAALNELKGYTANGSNYAHCVQKHEPCGVQTDRREKRALEIVALKKAWNTLGGDPSELEDMIPVGVPRVL